MAGRLGPTLVRVTGGFEVTRGVAGDKTGLVEAAAGGTVEVAVGPPNKEEVAGLTLSLPLPSPSPLSSSLEATGSLEEDSDGLVTAAGETVFIPNPIAVEGGAAVSAVAEGFVVNFPPKGVVFAAPNPPPPPPPKTLAGAFSLDLEEDDRGRPAAGGAAGGTTMGATAVLAVVFALIVAVVVAAVAVVVLGLFDQEEDGREAVEAELTSVFLFSTFLAKPLINEGGFLPLSFPSLSTPIPVPPTEGLDRSAPCCCCCCCCGGCTPADPAEEMVNSSDS